MLVGGSMQARAVGSALPAIRRMVCRVIALCGGLFCDIDEPQAARLVMKMVAAAQGAMAPVQPTAV
jgi:hypothetical protein